MPEILRHAADSGHAAPDDQRPRHDPGAAPAIRQHRDRNRQRRVKQREGEPTHQAELRIGQPQVFLDRNGEDADDLSIDEIEGVDENQDAQHIGPVSVRRSRCLHASELLEQAATRRTVCSPRDLLLETITES